MSPSFQCRILRFIVLSCFVISIGWQAHRQRTKKEGPLLLLRGGVIRSDGNNNVEKKSTFRSIFHCAYDTLFYHYYNPDKKSYSRRRMLSSSAPPSSSNHIDIAQEEEGGESHSSEEEGDLSSELSIEVSYTDTYDTLIFLGVSFLFGELSYHIGIPPLVGQIIAGFLLGPPLADFVPFPQAMVLLGDLGLILLLVEAGIELDVALVKEAGVRPLLIAVAGSVIPFSIGLGVTMGNTTSATTYSIRSAIASGACFSPTSLGVAANALSGGKALNTPVGQLIVASAVIDDMIGLIILSMLEVLVLDNPPLISYFIPIISAVGWLLVLGCAALTVIPYVVEKLVMPRFKEEHRPYVAFALLWLLVLAYLPMMYYTKASYLTGAFLAGLSFSQVDGVHHTFVSETGPIMEWLLRIFFSASIGFQVPIKMFGNKKVIAWGFAFYLAVLGKLPVGLFAPKYNEELPKNYPFNPYTRDVIITAVAMTCRGEFSFIIAAFGIGNGLLDPELYSAIVWAVLLSCITSPIILTLVLRYYNRLAEKYLEQEHSMVGGRGPLYVNIQVRSSLMPGIQESIKRSVNSMGLFVIDQRSWSPRGLNAVVATELYAVDSKTTIDLKKAVRSTVTRTPKIDEESREESKDGEGNGRIHEKSESQSVHLHSELEVSREIPTVDDIVAKRCEEIRQHLFSCPELVDAKINVIQWVPMSDAVQKKDGEEEQGDHLALQASVALKNKETIDTMLDEAPRIRKVRQKVLSGPLAFLQVEPNEKKETELESFDENTAATESHEVTGTVETEGLRRRPRRTKMVSSPAVGGSDMWQEDKVAQEASISAAAPVVQFDTTRTVRYGRRQRMKSDLSAIAETAPAIEERLSGLVRHTLDG